MILTRSLRCRKFKLLIFRSKSSNSKKSMRSLGTKDLEWESFHLLRLHSSLNNSLNKTEDTMKMRKIVLLRLTHLNNKNNCSTITSNRMNLLKETSSKMKKKSIESLTSLISSNLTSLPLTL